MGFETPSRVAVATYAPAAAFAPGARITLATLGYQLVGGRSLLSQAEAGADWRPAARIVDDRQLASVPDDPEDRRLPMILLTGPRCERGDDPRVVAALPRPAAARELYRMLQYALEPHPRSVPRVPAAIAARFVAGTLGRPGAIVSLSEAGCLLRAPGAPDLGRDLELWFPLPAEGLIHVHAGARYRVGSDFGLAFQGISHDARTAIADYVSDVLARA